MIDVSYLLGEDRRILVTGGAGFIGGAVIRRLLKDTDSIVFNLDKISYASDLYGIKSVVKDLGESGTKRYHFLQVDLADSEATINALNQADPDLILHLAAESHVDRSIDAPEAFLNSNIIGTFNLLQAARLHWGSLSMKRQEAFRFHHISTDEVFGSLGDQGRFCEKTAYDPRSPYSATKASSDHLVSAWHHTYGLPVVITNCSNNFGPWQFPEKLIPVVILKAISCQPIPLYGDGLNIRDWLYVEDHVDALLLAATKGNPGEKYCIGGNNERTNRQVVEVICSLLDDIKPLPKPYSNLIKLVPDRPGHDQRYAINADLISNQLAWTPSYNFESAIKLTLIWYLENLDWCKKVQYRSGYKGQRLGHS